MTSPRWTLEPGRSEVHIVDPCVPLSALPDGSRAIVMGKDQPEYQDLPSVRTPRGQVITRWSPSPEERQRIAMGEDIYLTILSRGAICPVLVTTGIVDWRENEGSLG